MVDWELELKALKEELDESRAIVDKLKQIIIENELVEELEDANIDIVSVEEKMCREGMNHLATLYTNGSFEYKDTQNFKILFEILQGIRGKQPVKAKKAKKTNIAELMSIVKGS